MLFQLCPVKTHRDHGLEDLWWRKNPDSLEFTCYDRSFAKNPGYYSYIYTDIKIANNTKINHICLKLSLREYSFITNKHNQELVNILENQKIYEGFLKTMVSLLRSFKNDLPNGNVLILIFSIYNLVNKKVLFCKWVLESETRNISILRKAS